MQQQVDAIMRASVPLENSSLFSKLNFILWGPALGR